MKIKVENAKFTGKHVNFEFKNGVAEVPEGDEEKAIKVANDLNYEIVTEKPKKAAKKAAKDESEVAEEVVETEAE